MTVFLFCFALSEGGGIRRIQRVSDVNAMGYTTPQPNSFIPNTFPAENSAPAYNYNDQINMNQNQAFAPNYSNQPSNQPTSQPYYDPYSGNAAPQYGQQPPQQQLQQPQLPQQPPNAGPTIFNPNPTNPANTFSGQFSMLQQPMVQDMALQYGQKLADQGKQLVETQFEKYVPVTRLKYYFAVDNNYVVKKMILLLFPFTHRVCSDLISKLLLLSSRCLKIRFGITEIFYSITICSSFVQKDWSLKYDQDNPVQPRYDLNAPDLYIPTMAYITFVVLAGLVMGEFTSQNYQLHSND